MGSNTTHQPARRTPRASAGLGVAVLLLIAGGAAALATGAAIPATAAEPCATAWAEGSTYTVGAWASYNGRNYEAIQAHTAHVGAGWNPAATPTLWRDLGVCGATTNLTPSPTSTIRLLAELRQRRPSPPPARCAGDVRPHRGCVC